MKLTDFAAVTINPDTLDEFESALFDEMLEFAPDMLQSMTDGGFRRTAGNLRTLLESRITLDDMGGMEFDLTGDAA